MASADITVTLDPDKVNKALVHEVAKITVERNAVYRERAHLVALLAADYPSHIGYTDPEMPDWPVVTVELPTGQACWHIAPADMDLFGHVLATDRAMRGWDGHSTEEKYRRIAELASRKTGAAS